MGDMRKPAHLPGERHRIRKELKRPLVYNSGWSLAQTEAATMKTKMTEKETKNLENPEEEREPDFQSYHIIRLNV